MSENAASGDQSCPRPPKRAAVINIEDGKRYSYQLQHRKCGKASCKRCRDGGQGHGPYWYRYRREGEKIRSTYIGKQLPPGVGSDGEDTPTDEEPSYLTATALATA